MISNLLLDTQAIIPELLLLFTIVVLIISDLVWPVRLSKSKCALVSSAGLALAGIALSAEPHLSLGFPTAESLTAPRYFFGQTLVRDKLSQLFALFFILGTAFIVVFSYRSRELARYRMGEYFSLLIGATLAACLLAASNNLLLLYICLETLSLSCYVLVGYNKHNRASAEASLKYLLYGAVASAIMLFGITYLYGLTGSLRIDIAIANWAPDLVLSSHRYMSALAGMLFFVGLGFKIACFPFHFWSPDVYQGAPTSITAYLSVVSKGAGVAALLRLLLPIFTVTDLAHLFSGAYRLHYVHIFFAVIACLGMTLGNLAALKQTCFKRLLAYSSIAHAGYIIAAFAAMRLEAAETVLSYLVVYLFMNLGVFWVLLLFSRDTGETNLSSFAGYAYKEPLLFVLLFISLIALTGLPPTAGFAVKFLLFGALVDTGVSSLESMIELSSTSAFYLSLVLIGLINSAISLFYYMNIARVMLSDSHREIESTINGSDRVFALILALPVVALINFGWLTSFISGCFGPVSKTLLAIILTGRL